MSAKAKPRILLVDGNNVIHAWPDLLEMHRRRKGLAHAELSHRLTLYQDHSGVRVVLVFDGRGPHVEEESPAGGIQIFYTDSGRTADDVIERLTLKYAEKFEILVATDDRSEQDAVIGLGALALSTEWLRDEVDQAGARFRAQWKL